MKILAEFLLLALLYGLSLTRAVPKAWKGRLQNALKAWFTVRAFWLLLEHPVKLEDGSRVVAWKLILDQVRTLDASVFWAFTLCATSIKFVGILASMSRWRLLLAGQGIDLPFRHVFGAFLVGRFIGTFLPSTAGLDGYKLYDAARWSGRSVEATAATALEKVLGVSGIFLSFLVALPFGIKIFGERAGLVAGITVPISLAIIGALLALLWFPRLIQGLLEALPIPGKARLGGVVIRVSRATAAYRDKKTLVLMALFLSFVVHFTTAAMYYFTALAVGAGAKAEFWPLAFGSSIQIFATVIAPTMGGVGAREWAQYVTLGHMIGPAAAIVSAALGFWAAEALTLFGGVFWWTRGEGYRPAYCRVDGAQVDYDEAAKAALALGAPEPATHAAAARVATLDPIVARVRQALSRGLYTGIVAGIVFGAVEAWVISRGGFGEDAQVIWYGPLAYAIALGLGGAGLGATLGLLPVDRDEIRGWTPSLVWLGLALPIALAVTLFRVRRDLFHEQMPPLSWLAGIGGGAAVIGLLLLLLGPRLFRGIAGRVFAPGIAVALLVVAVAGGVVAAPRMVVPKTLPPIPEQTPAHLAQRPNVILIMVDTLRADQLSCHGGPVEAKALCGLAADGGSIFTAFSHASWTKPASASLLTSLLPSSHGAMSKTASLSPQAVLVSEAMKEHGYVTGGIVSNINLAPSFGFDQGWDEYEYLAPDYLAGAEESSSKLILYQILRKVWLPLVPGESVGDYYQNAETVNAHAFEWLGRHTRSRFFLFLHYMDPHDPYFAHPYDGKAIARVAGDPAPSLAAEMLDLYRGEIAYLDDQIARLVERLKQDGVYDSSLIVVTADHGEEFHEHGGWWHGLTLYDEQIHVPLLVKWPRGHPEAPARVEGLARTIDVVPTILGRVGATIPPSMQGIDLLTPTSQRDEKDRLHLAEEDHEGNVLRALRTENWKLIEANEGNPRGLPAHELFDVAQDPGETRNLHQQRTETASELRQKLDAGQEFARSQAIEGGAAAELSDSQREALKALGYIQ